MQYKNSSLRFFRSGSSIVIPFRWIHRLSSTLASTPTHTSTEMRLFSQQQQQQQHHHHFSSVTDTFLSVTGGKTLKHNVSSEGVISPIGTSQSRSMGIRCREDIEGLEKNEKNLQNLLNKCIENPSKEIYEKLLESSTKYYKLSPLHYWSLHSRVLANYGVQCFIDQKANLAVKFLREAIECIILNEGETSVLHLRVILANSLAYEGKCFDALCEYETILTVLRDYPVESSLSQIVSGKNFKIPLSRNYIIEDFDRFLGSEEVVVRALSQGQRRLQLSDIKNSEKVNIMLIMARLQRRLGEKDASLPLYTSCLSILIDSPDVDMEIRVAHDLGILFCFETFDVTQGLPYLQAASEMSFDIARTELNKLRTIRNKLSCKNLLNESIIRIRRAAFTLLDTAVCFAENEEVEKSLGLFEESINFMIESGMQQHSAWASMKYADALATASLVDKAIRIYLETMNKINSFRNGDNDNLQLACMGMTVPLTLTEVEGRLAHCFQIYVGDYRRACIHYSQAIRRCGINIKCPFKVNNENNIICNEEVDSETLCWMLEKYADCCERIGNFEIAEKVLEHRVKIEKSLGGSCASAFLRLAQLHTLTNTSRALELYIYLLRLPNDAIEPEILLQSAYGFASICYNSKDEEMEISLSKAVSISNNNNNNNKIFEKNLDLDPNDAIIEAFKKSSSVIMASHAIDKERLKGDRDDELKALMSLSRGGFFFQRRGEEEKACELYRLAVEYTQDSNIKSEEYSRELAVMLANYATVMVHKDTEIAQKLYDQAVMTCPTDEDVSTAAASFFVLTANYMGGKVCIQRMINATTDDNILSRLYGKLAWLGVVCWDELTPNIRLECLQHLLLALGVKSDNLVLINTESNSNPLEGPISLNFKKELLYGMSVSQDQDTVSLAGYVAQTKLHHEGKFINECYKIALSRFPHSTTILVNYAKFCADYGILVLARKYYAAAFRLSQKDSRISECYADYLAFLNGKEHHNNNNQQQQQQQQVVAGESLVRYQIERNTSSDMSPSLQAQAYTLYGKYIVTCMPCPTIPINIFEEALTRDPADARARALYCSFLWNMLGRALNPQQQQQQQQQNFPEAKTQLALKVETLYLKGLSLQPNSVLLLTALGALYVELGERFEDAVRVLEQARKLSPQSIAIHRLLSAAFHDEWLKEEKKITVKKNTRLQMLIETLHQMYEVTIALEPSDRFTLTRYCQFALQGLQDKELATQLMQRLSKIPKE